MKMFPRRQQCLKGDFEDESGKNEFSIATKMAHSDEFDPFNANHEQTLSLFYLKTSAFVDGRVA